MYRFLLHWFLSVLVTMPTGVLEARMDYPPVLKPVYTASGWNPEQLYTFGYMKTDNRGYLCITAKHQGVACFDGIELKKVHGQDSYSLIALGQGADRRLYFATADGLFELYDGQARIVKNLRQMQFAAGEKMRSLHAIDDASLYISTNYSLYRYRQQPEQRVERLFDYAANEAVFAVQDRTNGQIALGTNRGLMIVNAAGEVQSHSFKKVWVKGFLDDLIITSGGVYRDSEQQPVAKGNFQYAYKRRNGQILLTGNRGLCVYRPAHGQERVLCPEHTGDSVRTVYEDAYHNLWAVTDNGLKVARRSAFLRIDQSLGLLGNKVMALEHKDKKLYIGTPQGINVLDTANGALGVLANTERFTVRDLLITDDILWIATTFDGIYRYNLSSQRIDHVLKTTARVTAMAWFDGAVWAATQFEGIYKLDHGGQVLAKRLYPAFKRVTKMAPCGDYLVVATRKNGIIKLGKGGALEEYTDKLSFPIFTCNGASLLAGTKQKAVLMNIEDGPLAAGSTHLTASGVINSLFVHDNRIWVLQDNGIFRIRDGEFVLKERKMLSSIYYNNSLVLEDYLFAGGTKGLYIARMDALNSTHNGLPSVQALVDVSVSGDHRSFEARISDLAAQRDYTVYWKYPGDAAFRPMKGAVLEVLANANDQANNEWEFRVLAANVDGSAKANTATENTTEQIQAGINALPVLVRYPPGSSGISTDAAGIAHSSPANPRQNTLPVTGISAMAPSLYLVYGLLALLSMALLYFISITRRAAMAAAPVVPVTGHSDQAQTPTLKAPSPADLFSPEHCQAFGSIVMQVQANPLCHKDYSRRIKKLMDALDSNPDLEFEKAYRVAEMAHVDEAQLRSALQKVFNCGKLLDFIAAYYHWQRQDRACSSV